MTHTTQQQTFKTETLDKLAQELKANGLRIFYSEDKYWRTYFYFTDGTNIGYVQDGYFGHGVRFTTVHKPCKECGTGFGLQNWNEAIDEPTIKDANKAFITAPSWAKKAYIKAVKKYNDIDDFLKANSQFTPYIELL